MESIVNASKLRWERIEQARKEILASTDKDNKKLKRDIEKDVIQLQKDIERESADIKNIPIEQGEQIVDHKQL